MQKISSIALVDCNNFFVSCERRLHPALRGRPVVVLSNNEGCIIARSEEVKALGVPMGAPFFKWEELLTRHKVAVCPPNFSLYGACSREVMEILASFNPDLEIYSIDEAFLEIEGGDPLTLCRGLREQILKKTAIPVSIGVGPSKTLAKVANHEAKKKPALGGVSAPSQEEFAALLATLPVDEVWGIGRRLSLSLAKKGIHTAAQLCAQPDLWLSQVLSVIGLRTVWELRGIPCLSVEQIAPPQQSIMTSRSFKGRITHKEGVIQAVCSYAARGAEKLREEGSRASWLRVFITTSPHVSEKSYYAREISYVLPEPTAYTPTLLKYATQGVEALFKEGFAYKKAGVLLGGLISQKTYQRDLFTPAEDPRKPTLMALLDEINDQFGPKTLYFASENPK